MPRLGLGGARTAIECLIPILRISVFTCRRPILHPSAASKPLSIREPAKGYSRCSRSSRRMIVRSASGSGRGK